MASDGKGGGGDGCIGSIHLLRVRFLRFSSLLRSLSLSPLRLLLRCLRRSSSLSSRWLLERLSEWCLRSLSLSGLLLRDLAIA